MIPHHYNSGVCFPYFAATVVPSMSRAQITEHWNRANYDPSDGVPHLVAAQFTVYSKLTKARENVIRPCTQLTASLLNLQWDVIQSRETRDLLNNGVIEFGVGVWGCQMLIFLNAYNVCL